MSDLNQYVGDSGEHEIPLEWNGEAFAPGTDWSLIFTAKNSLSDQDEAALIQKTLGIGLSVTGSTAKITIVPQDTQNFCTSVLEYDVQAQHNENGKVQTVARGKFSFVKDVTRKTESSVEIYTTEAPAPQGPSGTLTVGTVETVPFDEPAEVTNSGTNKAAVFNFKIPAGPPTLTLEKRHAWLDPFSYCGTAANGTGETATTWAIDRIEVNSNGIVISNKSAVGAWSNKENLTYQ
jgi:hypothetical protein